MKYLIVPLMVLLLMPIASAQSVTQTVCIDNSTLEITKNDTRCISGVCKDFAKVTQEACPNGCDPEFGICSPSDSGTAVIVIGAIIGFIVAIIAVVRLTK